MQFCLPSNSTGCKIVYPRAIGKELSPGRSYLFSCKSFGRTGLGPRARPFSSKDSRAYDASRGFQRS